jgi:hypothetical protein
LGVRDWRSVVRVGQDGNENENENEGEDEDIYAS